MKINWNQWRKDYDSMTFEDQKEFYQEVKTKHPSQKHYELQKAIASFEDIREDDMGNVVELGGWSGELSTEILKRFPIKHWYNYDLIQFGRNSTRYTEMEMSDYLWNIDIPVFNIFVATHTLEHIKVVDVKKLVKWSDGKCNHIIIETPISLSTKNKSWNNYSGSHILEVGWNQLEDIFNTIGFHTKTQRGSTNRYGKKDS
jgi:hypothetical protein